MKTFRQLIGGKGYEILSFFVGLMADGGKTAELEGQRLLNSQNETVLGALFNAAGQLYEHQRETGDPKTEKTLAALHTFLGWQAEMPCQTWGKRSILFCLLRFKEAGLLSVFSPEELEIARKKTDITDFFDKSALKLYTLPNNYMELALWLLEARQKLGWETEELCSAVRKRWKESLSSGTDSGYMDDCPPDGRFDSYTFMPIISSAAVTPMPERARRMLRDSALWFLSMANRRGDGFCYGRSLSVYGDIEPVSVLRAALQGGVLDEDETALAHAYLYAIFEKFFTFWYDEKRHSFNIWWDGRGTDDYREVHRALEVNIEFALNFIGYEKDMEANGLLDTSPADIIPRPAEWEITPFVFRETPYPAESFVLRRGDLMMMLPLIGPGKLNAYAHYQPFPASCGYTEVSAQSRLPLWVPEYRLTDGTVLKPIQYYTHIEYEKEAGAPVIRAQGYLARSVHGKSPDKTDYHFRTEYRFAGNTITLITEAIVPGAEAVLCCPENGYGTVTSVTGYDRICTAAATVCDLRAPHGPITEIKEYHAADPHRLTVTITLPDAAFQK